MSDAVETSILKTIAYFDIFDFPLTEWEVYKNLWQPEQSVSFSDVRTALAQMVEKEKIGTREGFFFIKRKNSSIVSRKARYLLAQKKMKKARCAVRLISALPFIRAIFVCNDLSYLNASDRSDIDLAIMAAKNRIWTARFLTAGLMAILGKRPSAARRADKICLSFYIVEDGLNLKKLAYQEDVHFIYWLSQFLPIYGQQTVIDDFFAQNSWLKNFLPNWQANKTNQRWHVERKFVAKKLIETVLRGALGLCFEKLLKMIQLYILPKHLLTLAEEENTDVVISDRILKFHDKDVRLAVKNEWKKCAAGQGLLVKN